VVSNCVLAGSSLLSASTQRVVLEATEVAVIRSNEAADGRGIMSGASTRPAAAALGGRAAGEVMLLVRFALPFGASAVERAFLWLSPVANAAAESGPVLIEVADVLEPWNAHSVRWASRPQLSASLQRLVAGSSASLPIRFDVTTSVARAAGASAPLSTEDAGDRDPLVDLSLGVTAKPQGMVGIAVATGEAEGAAGPRLDVYLR
jgi:hypothetical protein